MQGYDVIGDVHGCYAELQELLARLGSDPERKLIFLGDLVDRGTEQRETLELVMELCAKGRALCVMGNHEYNTIMRSLGLRTKQEQSHEVFEKSYPQGSESYKEVLAWMKARPLWLDLPRLGVVHACFFPRLMKRLTPLLDEQHRALSDELFLKSAKVSRGGEAEIYDAVETILKGTELKLPAGFSFKDQEGNVRHEIRTKWWLEHPSTYRQVCLTTPEEQIPDLPVPDGMCQNTMPDRLCVVGHYWLRGRQEQAPTLEESVLCQDKVYCVDFSCVRGGALAALRVNLLADRSVSLQLLSVPSRRKA